MRIGYFGGSFDPPHRGHLAVACAARDHFDLDEVLLVPTGKQPFKPGGAAASYADRLAMTALLCEGQPGLEASALDAPHPDGSPNYTIDALRQLRGELAADAEIYMIVGADTFLGVPQWRAGATLLREVGWIVVSRPGVAVEDVKAVVSSLSPAPKLELLTELADPTSATQLREALEHGALHNEQLTPAVSAYLREHKLYGIG